MGLQLRLPAEGSLAEEGSPAGATEGAVVKNLGVALVVNSKKEIQRP